MRKKLIAGNWKMNLTYLESEQLANGISSQMEKKYLNKVDVAVFPTFVSLQVVSRIVSAAGIKLGAQNLYFENDGAYTGEISARILKEVGCKYVIIGHSERRKYLHETNQIVNKKIKKALEFELKPIVCVGETLQEREDEIYEAVVQEQVMEALEGINEEQMRNVTIAYEPVWAIGTGMNATPKQISAMHGLIEKTVHHIYNEKTANELLILYGGSVNANNSTEILSACGVDGTLVGGASLKADEFISIVKKATQFK